MKIRQRIKKSMKLIRDIYPIEDDYHAAHPYDTIISAPNLWPLLLIGKMHEEVEEIRADMAHPNEYADLLDVLMDCAEANGVEWRDVEIAREDKRRRLGGFTEGKVLYREAGSRDVEVDLG